MNTLSWLIYAADVTDTAKGLCIVALVIICIVLAGCGVIWLFNNDQYGDDEWRDGAKLTAKHLARWAIPIGLAATLLPSSSTVYAIAASEMGERAINSQTGGKAVKALNAWLDRQIADEPKAGAAK